MLLPLNIFQELDMVVSYLSLAGTHLRVAAFSCLEYVYKKQVYFHTKTIPPPMHFLISFYSAAAFQLSLNCQPAVTETHP